MYRPPPATIPPPPPPRPPRRTYQPTQLLINWLDPYLKAAEHPVQVYKRRPYCHHMDRIEELDWVFRALQPKELSRGALMMVHHTSGVPYTTIATWRTILKVSPDWRPSREAYAAPRRMFTDAEEWELMSRVNAKFLHFGLFFNDEVFRDETRKFRDDVVDRIEARARRDPQEPEVGERYRRLLEFAGSDQYIADFRARHEISLRRPSFKRWPSVETEAINRFIEKVRQILVTYPADRVINIDETHWKLVNPVFLTWAPRGQKTVQCKLADDEKAGVTAIGAIDAAGNRLDLTVLAKGKTKRCLGGYALPSQVFKLTSPSGWTTSNVMCRYLQYLRDDVYPEGPLVVILDTYSAHRTEDVKRVAGQLDIELVFIPPGCTNLLQPLDRRVFGVMKSYGRKLWREHYARTKGGKTSREDMAAQLVETWNSIDTNVISSAWDIYWQEDGAREAAEQEAADDPRDSTYRPPLRPEADDALPA